MVASAFTAPHVTLFMTADVTPALELVRSLREDPDFVGVRVTPLLLVTRALILACRRNPGVNASWDDAAQEIVLRRHVNVGVAAATPRGLLVPNIKRAETLDLVALARELQNLTTTAREGRTSISDMQDGTITVTNVGTFGVDAGTPILNPGEAAILCFGAVREQPWMWQGKMVPRHITQLALSFDHRLVDGELGARVLADIAAVLSNPTKLLTWA
jgi:pyruvate dehydrogenase E2 component (dihydrolipoamide acetyltransferase)